MPEICRFQGIVVFMNYSDHNPPHFHAKYQDQEVIVEIQTGVIDGRMTKQALRMLLDWADVHQQELLDNWERARMRKPLVKIAPPRAE